MKASYRWLRALLEHSKAPPLAIGAKELAERYTRGGLEVEAVTEYGAGTDRVVVAEVRKIEPHPTRDKLRLVTVERGGGEQRIVCGAPNVPAPGGLVALAPLGTTLPSAGMTLTARDIGGVASEGMLVSEIELGLIGRAGSDPGIIILPPKTAAPGTPLDRAVPAVHDWILDIGLTPNRPDGLGHVGLAREAAALLDRPFVEPIPDAPARIADKVRIEQLVTIAIEDTERCPHYGGAVVTGVSIGPSPAWLRYRLESLGVRSISNVVDITNLLLLEWGHPTHAFDLDRVRDAKIVVRRARAGEKLTTLDGVVRALDPDDLVICDGGGPVALAGIMGGADSEIRPTTTRVLLECAYFSPRGVRRSARRHGMHTEASHRFERGVDPGAVPDVLAHGASLFTSLAGGTGVPGNLLAGVPLAEPATITLRATKMRGLLGVDVPMGEAAGILRRLGCDVQSLHEIDGEASSGREAAAAAAAALEADTLLVRPPTHRPDLGMEADLIEEVVRVRGLDTVPSVVPAIRPQPPRTTGVVEQRVRRAAVDVGLSEAVVFGFVSPRELEAVRAPAAAVKLLNPLTEDRGVMRTSLLPGLFEALRRARNRGQHDVRLFATGVRFLGPLDADGLPDEASSFAAVLAGERRSGLRKPEPIDVWDAKGVALEIVERVTGRKAEARTQKEPAACLHPRAAGDVLVNDEVVGRIGVLHPDVVDALDLGGSCVVVELDVRALERLGRATPRYAPIPMLPAATRDIALVVHDDVTAGAVAEAIRDAAGDLCEGADLFDLFRGANVPADHRSLAYHVVYRDPKSATEPELARTLTDEEVDARHKAVVDAVQKRFGATLRH